MTIADDKEQFEQRWNNHISELNKLGFSLPHDDVEDLRECIQELEELVEVAADNVDE